MATQLATKDLEKKDAAPQVVTPMSLLQAAQETGGTVEQLQKLMEMQFKWEENEARKAFNLAMARFRQDCPSIDKTGQAHNSKYAPLHQATETINPIASEHGLSYRWRTKISDDGEITVTCVITHIQGHSEETPLRAAPDKSGGKNSIQAVGSTVSYLERYTLFAALGLASKEILDDDGNQGRKITQEKETPAGNSNGLVELPKYKFETMKPKWKAALDSMEKTKGDIMNSLVKAGFFMTEEQKQEFQTL